MTLNQLIYEVRSVIRRNNLFDDDKLENRLIKHFIENNRALWLKQSMDKGRIAFTKSEQNICMPLEVVDRSACSGCTVGYSLLRTESELPKTVEGRWFDGITEVAPVDRLSYPFSYVPYKRARWAGSGKFNRNGIYCFRYTDDYIYVTSRSLKDVWKYLERINVKGVFEDPTELTAFTHVDGSACYTYDDDYPINKAAWVFIRTQILKDNFDFITRAPVDKTSDSNEQTNQQEG